MSWTDSPPSPAGPIPASGAPVLGLRGVCRSYAGRRALGPVDLTLDAGAVCVVEGENGSGKTTLLRVAAGSLVPTVGSRRCAGPGLYLSPGSAGRDVQTVEQALGWVARMTPGRGASVSRACDVTGLQGLRAARLGALSAGQRVRVSAAVAVVAGPALACLDEPTAHLDPAGVAAVGRAVEMLAATGSAVLVATHHPTALGEVADGGVRLHAGRPEGVRS